MASEYGWDDDTIGELPLVRLRQITAAIQMRRYTAAREENARFSWLARNLSSFIAAGYQVEKGKENKALAHAGLLAYDEVEATLLGAEKPGQPKENGVGSYERFMQMASGLDKRGKML